MRQQHRADGTVAIRGEAGAQHVGAEGAPPLGGDALYLGAVRLGDVRKAVAERADAAGEHLVARRKDVDHRGFQAAGARRGEDEDIALRLERVAQTLDDLALEAGVFRAAVVDHGARHGQERLGRDRGGAGNR